MTHHVKQHQDITRPWASCIISGGLKRLRLWFYCLSALFLLLNTSYVGYSQDRQNQAEIRNISGYVRDSAGNVLPDVTVRMLSSGLGVKTDKNGRFQINNVPTGATLVFSHVGFNDHTVSAGVNQEVDVMLSEGVTGLNEVVVIGYGTQGKQKITGSVGTIDSKVLEARPVTTVSQALQGMAGGLNITQSGSLGGSLDNRPSINIRGIATIGQGSTGAPLILIDGMEGDINAINPQDIDNISVLKDAAASSIYGSRAPFGVILITTKNGSANKVQVNYTNNFNWSSPVLLPEMADSYSFALFFNDAYRNAGSGDFLGPDIVKRIQDYQAGLITTTNIPDPANPNLWATANTFGNANHNMYDAVYKKSTPANEHSISASGGNAKTTYFISGNFRNENGLLKLADDNFKRYTTTAKISTQLASWATVQYSGRFIREEFEKPSSMTASPRFAEFTMNQYFTGWMSWPIVPLYDDNGKLYSVTRDSQGGMLVNGGRSNSQNDWTYHQLNLTLEPIRDWKIFANINYRINDYFRHANNQKLYGYNIAGDPMLLDGFTSVQEETYRTNYFSPNIYSEYTKKAGDHFFKGLVGFQSEETKTRNLIASRQGIIVPNLPVLGLTSGTDVNGNFVAPIVGGQYGDWATMGYFGRLNYDYKGKYLIEANLRYDGTSRFRRDKQWNLFPSVSVGWNVAQESFWQNMQSAVSMLKFRGSYGELGNQNTTNWYPTYATMPVGISNGTWLLGGVPPNTANAPALISSGLTWERIKTWNLGVDASFFRSRLSASFDYFTRFTNDMIGPALELPAILGTAVPPSNNTDLKTYGFEFDLNWQDRLKNGLGYTVHLILSDAQTKILKYPNPTGNINSYRAGTLVGDIWGLKTKGIAQTQKDMDDHLNSLTNGAQNPLGNNWRAGDIMYEDLNGDGKIDGGANTTENHGDLMVIGNTTPRYSFGFDIGLNFKGFDVRTFFQGILKRDYFRGQSTFFGASGQVWWSTAYVPHMDYFRDDPDHPLGLNKGAYYPRPLFNTTKNQIAQTRYLQDASYVRLKNIQVGYTIPTKVTSRIKIKNMRVYVSGENMWTHTRMSKIFDPETIDGGYLGAIYPLMKRISFGTSVTF